MDKLNKLFQFTKWYYYLDEEVCYKTNIIKIKSSISKLILSKNKTVINLLYKIIKDYEKYNTNLHYFLHLMDNKHYSLKINTCVDFIVYL